MSSSPQPARLRFHASPKDAARNSIISSSAKGWSPLQINKRDSVSITSPLKPSPNPSDTSPNPAINASPRRTSSSFKHVTTNSLVSNSPFKSHTTSQGQQTAGLTSADERVIHERGGRNLGESPAAAVGVASTPKANIGLGISAQRPRSTSRSASGSGSAVSGTRRVSNERGKVAFPSGSGERRSSGGNGNERKVSGSKENESPDVRAAKRTPRHSMGLKGLAKSEYVSRSPFKRVPSGGLSSSNRLNESPSGPSPKTIPVEKDDVFGSPSPSPSRMPTLGKRRPSPNSHLVRQNSSPTPSPPRGPQPSLGPSPSPLGQMATLAPPSCAEPSPSPTPVKSSMTPSRRLRGPRGFDGTVSESPTRSSKTVTFQSVPDVKEFERMSVEGSADGSFEVEKEDDEEWADDTNEDSLEGILIEPETLERASVPYRVVNPDSPTQSAEDYDQDESTTADFMNTLVQEGLFSPPELSTPAFENQPIIPNGHAPFLSTPSLGEPVQVTPLLANIEPDQMYADNDEVGIPYGRSHHAERNLLAHASPEKHVNLPPQPDIPNHSDHHMLLNANAAQPALPHQSASVSEHLAHQSGPMPDPFITIQTATKVLSPPADRTEDGIPLGRTSHHDRIAAARMLATQSLGLGMPRSPAISKNLTRANSETVATSVPLPSPTPTPGDEDGEMLFDASFEMSNEDERGENESPAELPSRLVPLQHLDQDAVTPRRLPKPPKVEEVKLPSPVSLQVPVTEAAPAEKQNGKFDFTKGFNLPAIGFTSPLFSTSTALPAQERIPSDATTMSSESDTTSRPLTPPPMLGRPEKEDSPHRIPSFDFAELKLDVGEEEEKAAVEEPLKSVPQVDLMALRSLEGTQAVKSKTTEIEIVQRKPSRPVSVDIRKSGELQPVQTLSSTSAPASGSTTATTTKVRQRISREMIRETIQQRIADGTLNRNTSNASGRILDAAIPPIKGKDKELPPPPELGDAILMAKAHTTDAAPRKVSEARPTLRPRSQTQSAHEVLKANVKDGVLEEPKSGLDKLMIGHGVGGEVDKDGKVIHPVSILRKPEDKDSLLPPATLRSPIASPISPVRQTQTAGGTSAREAAINAQRREKEDGEGVKKEGSRRKARRSMSTGDMGEDAEANTVRRSMAASPRLTLGIGEDSASILDSLREDMSMIGSDRGYKVREKHVAKARYDGLQQSRSPAGDLDAGKAWRSLRRPSDMNEHAAELKRLRAQEASAGKTSGTIFVKVLGIESLNIPLPEQDTFFCVTLDNGIDYIRTPYLVLKDGAKVNQEFSLVEHPNFEFSLSLDIRRDPHILKALHEKSNPAATSARGASTTRPTARPTSLLLPSKHDAPGSPVRGLRALFHSPRKARTKPSDERGSRSSTPLPPQPLPQPGRSQPRESIAKYLIDDRSSTLAKTHIAFGPIAKNCQAKILEMRYPMFAMFKASASSAAAAGGNGGTSGGEEKRPLVAKITLQLFRLPPLPGIKAEDMPQCIDEALRGMRHHAWHEHEYHEGVLTQDGGDCSHPKRRMFKLIGGNLVAINEVTKKEVASIDLRKATGVVDLNANANGSSPASRMTRMRDSDEGLERRPRSWMVEFNDGDGIVFWADKDEDKAVWMETLTGLIGKIPSNPLWAELLATQRREAEASESSKRARRVTSSGSLKSGSGANGQRRKSSGAATGMKMSRSASGMKRSASGMSSSTATATPAGAGMRRDASGIRKSASGVGGGDKKA